VSFKWFAYGETVIVRSKVKTGTDILGNAVYRTEDEAVTNVMVAPGPRLDAPESNRPNAHLIKYTLYFPVEFTSALEGCDVQVRGVWYRVVGSPGRYSPVLKLATRSHDLIAEVEAVHG
jgi:hypothetical protein